MDELLETIERLCGSASKGEGVDAEGFRKLYEQGDVIFVNEGDLWLLQMLATNLRTKRGGL
jgi:hypothetical protein